MTHDDVRAVFADAVPEIWDGVIEIMAIAGVPGEHLKVGLRSRESWLDPVGATMGMGGRRILPILQRIGGVIDLTAWPEALEARLAGALRPCFATIEPGDPIRLHDVTYGYAAVAPEDVDARVALHVRLAGELLGVALEQVGPARAQPGGLG
ncbi:MAG: hypothetical protein KC549_15840 [Myxococcales bacterium]|nr:hypothetical protein [Myxococcales bacterium]